MSEVEEILWCAINRIRECGLELSEDEMHEIIYLLRRLLAARGERG